MSSETFVTAIFLITAIIAAGVLVNAIFPSIYRASETFVAGSHEMDERMRTDVMIVNTVSQSGADPIARIWIKNTGVNPIQEALFKQFDIYLGKTGEFKRLSYEDPDGDPPSDPADPLHWTYKLYDNNNNNLWDRGETLEIIAKGPPVASGDRIFFQIVLPTGVRRNIDFSAT